MVHINKIKTLNGYRYAVVAPFKSTTKDKDGNMVNATTELVVDYKVGENILPAIFPYSPDGLEKAKEVQKLFKKS